MATECYFEWVNNIPVNNEEDQWLHDELLKLGQETLQWVGWHMQPGGAGMGSRAVKKSRRERFRIVHKMLIERGIKSPFEIRFNHETKHNPDKKKAGKKKKGGRRRI